MRRLLFVSFCLVITCETASAGLYSGDDPCPFAVTPDGSATPLPHPLFVALLVDRFSTRLPNDPLMPVSLDWYVQESDGRLLFRSTYAGRLNQLLSARWPHARQLSKPDLASHSAALIRLQAREQAWNLLLKTRPHDYPLQANLAHLHAELGQWTDALTRLPSEPDDPPPPLPGTSADQYRWQRAVDQTAYRKWLQIWIEESRTKPPIVGQVPYPLFETPQGEPIRYWESKAAAAALPSDAIVVVQQLLLWSPWDAKLLWTLAEVYAATGKLREAQSTFDMVVNGRKFTGPEILKRHVDEVAEAVGALPPEQVGPGLVLHAIDLPADQQVEGPALMFGLIDPMTFYIVTAAFAVAVVVLLLLQVRSVITRRRRWPEGERGA